LALYQKQVVGEKIYDMHLALNESMMVHTMKHIFLYFYFLPLMQEKLFH
jgi:hypothetical protein